MRQSNVFYSPQQNFLCEINSNRYHKNDPLSRTEEQRNTWFLRKINGEQRPATRQVDFCCVWSKKMQREEVSRFFSISKSFKVCNCYSLSELAMYFHHTPQV